MLCNQCGANVEDDARVCDNCGMVFEEPAEETLSCGNACGSGLPAVHSTDNGFNEYIPEKKKADIGGILVKTVSVICAVLCMILFSNAATYVKSAISASSSQSIMGGFFGTSSSGFPAEFYGAIHYAFIGMGVAFSGILIILGFKKK